MKSPSAYWWKVRAHLASALVTCLIIAANAGRALAQCEGIPSPPNWDAQNPNIVEGTVPLSVGDDMAFIKHNGTVGIDGRMNRDGQGMASAAARGVASAALARAQPQQCGKQRRDGGRLGDGRDVELDKAAAGGRAARGGVREVDLHVVENGKVRPCRQHDRFMNLERVGGREAKDRIEESPLRKQDLQRIKIYDREFENGGHGIIGQNVGIFGIDGEYHILQRCEEDTGGGKRMCKRRGNTFEAVACIRSEAGSTCIPGKIMESLSGGVTHRRELVGYKGILNLKVSIGIKVTGGNIPDSCQEVPTVHLNCARGNLRTVKKEDAATNIENCLVETDYAHDCIL